MGSLVSDILLGRLPSSNTGGKLISFAGIESDKLMKTGTHTERVIRFLQVNKSPATAKEVSLAVGVGTNNLARVFSKLHKDGKIDIRKRVPGCWVYTYIQK